MKRTHGEEASFRSVKQKGVEKPVRETDQMRRDYELQLGPASSAASFNKRLTAFMSYTASSVALDAKTLTAAISARMLRNSPGAEGMNKDAFAKFAAAEGRHSVESFLRSAGPADGLTTAQAFADAMDQNYKELNGAFHQFLRFQGIRDAVLDSKVKRLVDTGALDFVMDECPLAVFVMKNYDLIKKHFF